MATQSKILISAEGKTDRRDQNHLHFYLDIDFLKVGNAKYGSSLESGPPLIQREDEKNYLIRLPSCFCKCVFDKYRK